MQKVLDFLERHVQWVAIAIAAAFLAYALMSYLPVVATPVLVEVGGKQYGPGEVDPEIKQVADSLQNRIDGNAKVAIPVLNYPKKFTDELNKTQKPTPLPRSLISARAVDYPPNLPWGTAGGSTDVANNKVNVLPVLPPVVLEPAATTDFAQVTVAPAAAGATPVPAPAPVVPGASATAANAVDTTWVRIPFTVPAGKISQAFSAANLPGNLTTTSFLRVELLREKQLPGNQWGPEELVDILPTIAMPPLPPEGPTSLAAQQQYLVWANGNQTPIVQPDFFPIVAGSDPRMTKAIPAGGVADGPKIFDPETFPPAGAAGSDMSGLTDAEKAAVMKVRQRKAKEAKENQPKPPSGGEGGGRGGRGGGGGGGSSGGRSAPATPPPGSITITPFQYRPPAGGDPNAIAGDGGVVSDGGMGVPQAATPGSPIPVMPLPSAPFDPGQVAGGVIQGWAYDVTAAADSTYRYRVRYKIKNPIFGVQNVANNAAVIAQFALTGEDPAGWTEPITIAPLTHVYLSQLPTVGGPRVQFTVFRWQSGKRNRTNVFAVPGDTIGKIDNGIDYRTHWTLVEVRRDSSSPTAYALLMNADGVLRKVDFDADKATSLYKQLNDEVDGPQPQTATPTPGMPGGPVGGGPGAEGSTIPIPAGGNGGR